MFMINTILNVLFVEMYVKCGFVCLFVQCSERNWI